MTEIQTKEPTTRAVSRRTKVMRFVWHYVQMVIAMFVGMMVLMPLWRLAVGFLGGDLHSQVAHRSLAMAATMTIGMAAWMAFRRHSWISIAEMSAAMSAPFVLLLVPYGMGLISGDAVLDGGHVLMMSTMLGAMFWRLDEYTRSHRDHHAPAPAETR
jgi:flagellar biosynthetic protein FliP